MLHPGHAHDHGDRLDANRRALAIALGLLLALLAGEVVAGLLAGSLALLADAGHMITDAAALAMALAAASIAARPPRGRWTYGFRRLEILAAQANGIVLVVVAAWIVYAATRRLVDPSEVRGGLVALVALGGVAVNLAATLVLSRASRRSLNVRGAFLHLVTDVAAFAGTAAAGALILVTGWDRFDPLASLGVAALMLWASYGLLRESTGILLELAPGDVAPAAVAAAITAEPDVVEAHDVHLWTVTSGFPAFSAHVLVRPAADCHAVRRSLEAMLAERFELRHTTLQVEHAPRPLELQQRLESPAP